MTAEEAERMRKRIAVLLTAAAGLLTGCSANLADFQLWEDIPPADAADTDGARYDDGTYLTQTVYEPEEDPYKDDTKQIDEGTTKDGINYVLFAHHAEITGHTEDFDAEELTVPAEIAGKPVSRIQSVQVAEDNIFDIDKSGAFYGCYTLKKVTLPEGLKGIGNYAFYGCKNLKTVEMPESVIEIGTRAFAMCSNLETISVPLAIDTIGESAFALTPWYDQLLYSRKFVIFNGRLYDVGRQCSGAEIVPEYVVSISDYAFYACYTLKQIVITENVQSIGERAFCSCSSLKSVEILNPDCEVYDDISTFTSREGDDAAGFKGVFYLPDNAKAEKYAKKYKIKTRGLNDFRLDTEEQGEDEHVLTQPVTTKRSETETTGSDADAEKDTEKTEDTETETTETTTEKGDRP